MKRLIPLTLLLLLFALTVCSCGLIGKKDCEHSYTERVVAPSCEADGYTEHTCSKCGDSYQDAQTQRVAHPYKNVVVSPACDAEGYTEHTCIVCGDTYKDAFTKKIPHTYESEVVAPTCSEEGYTKHTCSECGDSYNDSYVGVTSHRFNAAPCTYCGMNEITENITPDKTWYDSTKSSFLISTPAQLAGLSSLVNSGVSFSDKKVYLDADIDLGYYEWIPIGTYDRPFEGTFSGEGFTVSGLKINAVSNHIGLFGYSKGTIANVTVKNATIYAKNDISYVSILCGYSAEKISDASVSGFVDAKLSTCVAGVVGATAGAVERCANSAEINGDAFVGGIAGRALNDISNSVNNGNVSGKSDCVGGVAGGVKGYKEITLSRLVNNGKVSGALKVGGIVGCLDQSNASSRGTLYDEEPLYVDNAGNVLSLIHKYQHVTSLNNIQNFGEVSASDENAGGILGYVYVESTYEETSRCCSGSNAYKCKLVGRFIINAQDIHNYGSVSSNGCGGELIGYFKSDESSTLTDYTVTGKITLDGEALEDEYDVGSNTNLTLSERVVCSESAD